jgi:hypothetical protein
MSLVLIVFALLCGRDDQESVPVMSHSVLAAYDVSADIIYGITVQRYVMLEVCKSVMVEGIMHIEIQRIFPYSFPHSSISTTSIHTLPHKILLSLLSSHPSTPILTPLHSYSPLSFPPSLISYFPPLLPPSNPHTSPLFPSLTCMPVPRSITRGASPLGW